MAATDPQDIIEAIDAAILVSAQSGFPVSYTIRGRTKTAYALSELLKLRAAYVQIKNAATPHAGRNYAEFGRD